MHAVIFCSLIYSLLLNFSLNYLQYLFLSMGEKIHNYQIPLSAFVLPPFSLLSNFSNEEFVAGNVWCMRRTTAREYGRLNFVP